MRPTPPPDPGVTALPAMLDGDAVAALLKDAFDADICGCVPRYVRYKPGTSCLVLYHLRLRDRTDAIVTVPMHIKVFGDDRGQRRAASARMHRLVTQAAHAHELPIQPSAYLPAIDGLLQVYPIDYDLPYLARAAGGTEAVRALRKTLPEFSALGVTSDPEMVRYKPGRKALLRYDVRNGPTNRIYGKLLSGIHPHDMVARTRALIDAGLSTAPVLGSRSRHGFVIYPEVPGDQLASLRNTPDFNRWMEPLAHALARLHSTPEVDAPTRTLPDEAAIVTTGATLLKHVVPHLADRIFQASQHIASRLSQIPEQVSTIHGDFYDDQALVSGSTVTLLDLDEMRRGHPLLDIGNMLAHLTAGAARGDTIDDARDAFLSAVQRRGGLPASDIAVFEAAALMKLAPGPFRRLEPDWPDGLERILCLAEMRIAESEHGASHIAALGSMRVTDPSLPQLDALQDASTMRPRFAAMINEDAVSIRRIEVVRHKDGRRAILRYEIEQGTSTEYLYGKTFASSRGPKVFDITRTITEARAFGEHIALPAPIAYLADLHLLVQRSVAGEPVEPALINGDTGLAARIAEALHRLHGSGLDLGRCHDLAKELAPLRMRIDQVIDHSPELRGPAEACLQRALRRDVSRLPWRYMPIHRDFYHAQVLVDDQDALAVLDLDDAAMSEPTIDVANFAAHLMLLGVQQHGSAARLQPVVDAFVSGYRALDPTVDPDLLHYLTATTLLRLSGIHVSRANGTFVAAALIDLAARELDA